MKLTALKLKSINPEDYILAIRAAKSFASEDKPVGIRHGTVFAYGNEQMTRKHETVLYVYRTKTMVVVRYSS
jgi:hypothetical protein